jgi:hypothetical protein
LLKDFPEPVRSEVLGEDEDGRFEAMVHNEHLTTRRLQWLRTWLTIMSVLVASASSGLGMVVWATQHYDGLVSRQDEQSKLMQLYSVQLNAMARSLNTLAEKENELAISVSKLQGFIGGREAKPSNPGLFR